MMPCVKSTLHSSWNERESRLKLHLHQEIQSLGQNTTTYLQHNRDTAAIGRKHQQVIVFSGALHCAGQWSKFQNTLCFGVDLLRGEVVWYFSHFTEKGRQRNTYLQNIDRKIWWNVIYFNRLNCFAIWIRCLLNWGTVLLPFTPASRWSFHRFHISW